jgi:Nucleotidyltransferase domain
VSNDEVWVYGSAARGDVDAKSDIDILIASHASTEWRDAVEADSALQALIDAGHEVSPLQFSWEELSRMRDYGSLFLHHVRAEGRQLTRSNRLSDLLASLPRYERGGQEINAFKTVLDDVRLAVSRDHSPAFELAVVATALRHSFILGCYVSGWPDFGRTSPFRTLRPELGLTHAEIERLVKLYDFRLYQYGRASPPFAPTTAIVQEWLAIATDLFARISLRVDDFYRTVH